MSSTMEGFGEVAAPLYAIRAILDSYPFSLGLLRELLQNSDDARASKQAFVLDCRTHGTGTLLHPKLKDMQGPALIGYSNALFSEEDWKALQNIHRSSKLADASKIGKYGVGFRSCYHVTDTPQILSGSTLAILNPSYDIWKSGGIKLDFVQDPQYVDQLSSFDSFLPTFARGAPFHGSIIRLPLRKTQSKIGKPVSIPEIHDLLLTFVNEEISACLLFLENITSIQVLEIDIHGRSSLCHSKIVRSPKVPHDMTTIKSTTTTCVVTTSIRKSTLATEKWRLLQMSFPQSDATSRLSESLGHDPTVTLSDHKLRPDVGIAVPLSIFTQGALAGRLYTYLPLPLETKFPLHIHSLFALTQSRQHLRNREERGLVRGSDDSVLVEWNQLLFDVYVPQAWTSMLAILMEEDHVPDIFKAWPSTEGGQDGDSSYWKDLPIKLLECIVNSGAPVWPLIGPQEAPGIGRITLPSPAESAPPVGRLRERVSQFFKSRPPRQAKEGLPTTLIHSDALEHILLAACDGLEMGVLRSLGALGLKIMRPPPYIYNLLMRYEGLKLTLLTPKNAHMILRKNLAEFQFPLNVDLIFIPPAISYLLSDGDLINISGLPLIPHPDGRRITLDRRGSSVVYTMLNEADFGLFGSYDSNSIALHALENSVSTLLTSRGPTVLNLQPLTPEIVCSYLGMDSNPLTLPFDSKNDCSVVQWLGRFWVWVETGDMRNALFPMILSHLLLPSSLGIKPTAAPIFAELGNQEALFRSLKQLGIPFFHHYFPASAQNAMKRLRPISDPNNLSNILDAITWEGVQTLRLSEAAVRSIFQHFVTVPQARQAQLNSEQRMKLRALPVFPEIRPQLPAPTPIWASIPNDKNIISVSMTSLKILPTIHDVVFLDGSLVGPDFLAILDQNARGPLADHNILSLALANFAAQTSGARLGFLQYIVQERNTLPNAMFEQFVQAMESVSIPDCFRALNATLNAASRAQFAEWLRHKVTTIPQSLQPVVRLLPIWPSSQPPSKQTFLLSANVVQMLPDGIMLAEVATFLNISVAQHSLPLASLVASPMTWAELFSSIRTSTPSLLASDRQKYRTFLAALFRSAVNFSWVPVPNHSDVMCRSCDLYVRDGLFLAAFGSGSDRFVAGAFQELEPELSAKFGLKSGRVLTMALFRECAAAVDGDLSPDRLHRARAIFRIYCGQLPLRDRDGEHWRTLDDLRFVPRKISARRKTMEGRDISAYLTYRDLPEVVAPKNILLEKYEAIAWTQRAPFHEEPVDQKLLAVHVSFGLPQVAEVVRHLEVLALRVSKDYPQDAALQDDIRATYQWLDNHADAAQPHMSELQSTKLFLNVTDPKKDFWQWSSAQELLFGIRQERSSFHVRKFLLSFQKLLTASGVERITDAKLTQTGGFADPSAESETLRSAFCLMRDANQLTDVVLITKEGNEPEQVLPAHRAYLAGCSTYFLGAFGGNFRESRMASADNPIKVYVDGYSGYAVRVLVDFLYTGVVANVMQDHLIEVMQLSSYWGVKWSRLNDEVQRQIVHQGLITPETYATLINKADAQESIVAEACRQYENDNRAILQRLEALNLLSRPVIIGEEAMGHEAQRRRSRTRGPLRLLFC